MATRWRRQAICVLIADQPMPVALRSVSGAGADLETSARPPLGRMIELHHPEAGMIAGSIVGHRTDGLSIAFDRSAPAVAFALAVITADMSRPG